MASALIATATAFSAAAFAWATTNPLSGIMLVSALITGVGIYLGGIICIWAASPVVFFSAGDPPNFWKWQLEKSKTAEEALTHQLNEYEVKIDKNKEVVSGNALLFKLGTFLGVLSPIAASILLLLKPQC